MSEMVRRVAAAVVEKGLPDVHLWKGETYEHEGDLWMQLDGDVNVSALVRAAIEAMRELTLEMRKACSFEEAERTWPTLVDAALGLEVEPTPASGHPTRS